MSQHDKPLPGFEPDQHPEGDAQQVGSDQLERSRQEYLQAAADKYQRDQEQLRVARRHWQNQRELAHINFMGQVPKLVGAILVGAVLAYLIPLGGDR
jgi:hypothetical protein